MPGTRNPPPAEFRDQFVALARAGRSDEGLAREFKPCAAKTRKNVQLKNTGLEHIVDLY